MSLACILKAAPLCSVLQSDVSEPWVKDSPDGSSNPEFRSSIPCGVIKIL